MYIYIMKTIPNFSRYLASEDGYIYSTNYKNSGKIKILKPALSDDGYLKTVLKQDCGKYKTVAVHREVAAAYLGEKPKAMEVNHINGIKTDNRPSNLEYCTRSENCKHSFDIGLQKPKKGELNGMAKLTNEQVMEIRNFVASVNKRYYGRKQLAEKYGISEAHLKDVVNKRRGVWT
jgi:hypothetical protein